MNNPTALQENEFVHEQLVEWGAFVEERMREALGKYGVGVTDDLLKSLKFQVLSGATGMNKGSIKIFFNEYGRFVDMGKGRGISESSSMKSAVMSKPSKRKPKKWYSKTLYGSINNLINRLAYDYQNWALQKIITAAKDSQK